jgi:hypothetical protein
MTRPFLLHSLIYSRLTVFLKLGLSIFLGSAVIGATSTAATPPGQAILEEVLVTGLSRNLFDEAIEGLVVEKCCRAETPGSESAVVAHFIACATPAAIANTIRAIHCHPRQALPGGVLDSSAGSGAEATGRS